MLGGDLTSEFFFLPTAEVFVFVWISLNPEPWMPTDLVDDLTSELPAADVFFLVQVSLDPESWLSADLVDPSCVIVFLLTRTLLETGLFPSNDFVRDNTTDEFFLARTSLNIELRLSKDFANKPVGFILLARTSVNRWVWLKTDLVDTSRLMISGLLLGNGTRLGLQPLMSSFPLSETAKLWSSGGFFIILVGNGHLAFFSNRMHVASRIYKIITWIIFFLISC